MTKREIYNKYNGHCAYCGKKLNFDDMTLDHIHPQSKGGKSNINNIYPCCHLCNNQKGNKSIEEFRQYLTDIDSYLDDIIQYRIALRYNKVKVNSSKVKFYFETIWTNNIFKFMITIKNSKGDICDYRIFYN